MGVAPFLVCDGLLLLLTSALAVKVQVRGAQGPALALLRAVVEQALSSGLSGCDLRICGVIRADQALIRGAYFA
jgi:hypothetical protein